MNDLAPFQEFGLVDRNGVPMVSSRAVAQRFNKEHKHVLRDIENLISSLLKIEEPENSRPNFGPSTYKDERGKKQPEYLMTRDGFTLLAMGFTGQKALQFKTAYIHAFNKMEVALKDLAAARLEYRPMTDAIQSAHDPAKFYHYKNEADLLNKLAIGMTAKQFEEQHQIPAGISPRAFMTPAQINLLARLQRTNTELILMGWDYDKRKPFLIEMAAVRKDKPTKLAQGSAQC